MPDSNTHTAPNQPPLLYFPAVPLPHLEQPAVPAEEALTSVNPAFQVTDAPSVVHPVTPSVAQQGPLLPNSGCCGHA
jgi:hypothetical protein